MNIKKIDPKLYKAIMMAFQYQINCELTPAQCQELVKFIDNPLIVEDDEVCEWKYTKEKDTEYSTLETYKNPHLNIVAEINYFQPKEFKYCFVCGKRIKYVEVE